MSFNNTARFILNYVDIQNNGYFSEEEYLNFLNNFLF